MRKFILLVWLASVVVPARDLRAEPIRLAILVEDQKLAAIMERFGRDHDGKLNPWELNNLRMQVLAVVKSADKKPNPALPGDGTELLFVPLLSKNFPSVAAMMQHYDSNNDGGLDATELKALALDLQKNP